MKGALLYICFPHPSGGGTAVHRTIKLARGFSRAGWEVVVLCGPNDAGGTTEPGAPYRVESANSLMRRPAAASVRRGAGGEGGSDQEESRTREPSRIRRLLREIVFFPDPQLYWIPSGLACAKRVLTGRPLSVVFCSGPPFSPFLLGWIVKKWRRVPLVLDYRDVWLDHPWWPTPKWRQGLEGRLERYLLQGADLVVANHTTMRRMLLDRSPAIVGKCIVVPNGFDREELGPPVHPTWNPGERLEILYAGTLYGPLPAHAGRSDALSVQRPIGFLTALRTLSERGTLGPGGVQATFVGAKAGSGEAERLTACAHEVGVSALVKVLPRMEKPPLVPLLRRAHLLLNILYYTEAQVTQKVYDYLHLEIPILSLLRESEANAALVRNARAGPIVDPADTQGIVAAIETIISEYRAGRRPIAPDRAFIDQFDLRTQCQALSERLITLIDFQRGEGGVHRAR